MGPGRSRGRGGNRGGSRGSSRGGSRGGMRGGARGGGRGGRGRGRGGRGGRGRGGRFKSSRLDEQEDSDDSGSEEEAEEEEAESEVEEEEEEEIDEEAQKRREAYMSLMKSFETRSGGPAAKRRKLDHDAEDDNEDDEEIEDADEAELEGSGSELDELAEDDEAEAKDVDAAEEEDEDADEEIEIGGDDDEQIDSTDPFESHFSAPDLKDVSLRLISIKEEDWLTSKVSAQGSREIFTVPQTGISNDFAPPAAITTPQQLKLKKRLAEVNTKPLRATELKVAPLLFNYYDTLFCERTPDNGEELRRMASLHAVNHIFKTRDRVLKNNEKLSKIARKQEEAGKAGGQTGHFDDDDDDDNDAFRDQGYNRPKVLILLPTRQSCARMVEAICGVCEPETQENRKRFEEGYVDKRASLPEDRPADFRELFEGNDDDMFRLGLKFTRKSIKFFSKFCNSDIILASPLGLRMAMGSEDTSASFLSDPKKKNRDRLDTDFLSSIEIVLMDQADALLMQNWEHVEHIFANLNMLPRANNDYDISRLRSWYLDDQARFYRQTVVFSAHHSPALAELFRRFCTNWTGRVRVQPGAYKGVVGRLGVSGIRQTFSRFDTPTIEADPDARFEYFVKAIVPTLIAKTRGGNATANRTSGVLVFIPSYLDFVRVRNWFATADAVASVSFGAVSEYASTAEASRAISHFLTGRHRVLLYTERAHHFRRHHINGVRTAILYGLPENPTFYAEITGGYLGRSQRNQILEPGQGIVRAMFSPFDAFKLERIVGSQRVGRMIRERSDTFVFEEDKGF